MLLLLLLLFLHVDNRNVGFLLSKTICEHEIYWWFSTADRAERAERAPFEPGVFPWARFEFRV